MEKEREEKWRESERKKKEEQYQADVEHRKKEEEARKVVEKDTEQSGGSKNPSHNQDIDMLDANPIITGLSNLPNLGASTTQDEEVFNLTRISCDQISHNIRQEKRRC